jgi:hypothetical protein
MLDNDFAPDPGSNGSRTGFCTTCQPENMTLNDLDRGMDAFLVSPKVGSVKATGPELLEPLG